MLNGIKRCQDFKDPMLEEVIERVAPREGSST